MHVARGATPAAFAGGGDPMKSGPARRVEARSAIAGVIPFGTGESSGRHAVADDIAAIELFAGLVHADRERLAQAAADVHLRPGEYAVHEGEERALFAGDLPGKSGSPTDGGWKKTIGWRLPGSIFGEVPITLGASFPGSFRASEPTRVLRLDARQYYVIAAAAPQVAVAVGTLARERLGGLQGLAAKPPTPQVTVIGHRWDPACHDLRRFLARNRVSSRAHPQLALLAREMARAARRRPASPGPAPGLPDGDARPPRPRSAAWRTGLASAPAPRRRPIRHGHHRRWPRRPRRGGLRRLRGPQHPVVECEAPGGQAGTSSRIENYLGFPTASPATSSRRARLTRPRLGAGDPDHPPDRRDRPRHPHRRSSTATRPCAPAPSSSPPA